jgi:hypothetical protein
MTVAPYDTNPPYGVDAGSFSNNALSAIIYPSAYDPTIDNTNNNAPLSNSPFAISSLSNFLPSMPSMPNTKDEWFKLAVFGGVFILVLLYFGSYLVKHS